MCNSVLLSHTPSLPASATEAEKAATQPPSSASSHTEPRAGDRWLNRNSGREVYQNMNIVISVSGKCLRHIYVHIYPYSFNLVGAEDSSLCNSCPSPLGLRVSEAAARVGGGRSLPEPERAEAGPRLSWGRGQRPSCSSGAAETVVSDRREVTQSGRSSDSDTVTQ